MLESRCPAGTAEDWDNVGLLVGDPERSISGAVVSVDLTERAIAEAVKRGHRLIVNHHPCIFPWSRGLSRVTAQGGNPSAALVFECIRRGIAVIACHTNFDRCALEVVEAISRGFQCRALGRLIDHPEESLLKLSVFVPRTHLEKVRDAVFAAGAGQIGNYDSCSFTSEGLGTFRGGQGTNPFLGSPGRRETAPEARLETVLPRGMERPVLQALRESHPYEEIAYDLYALEQAPAPAGLVRGLGYGFFGEFERARSFSDLAQGVKKLFEIDGFWITDPPPSRLKKIGFVAGKGASFVSAAAAAGCDLFITGEAGYHTALEASRRGMAVMELGHRESERFFLSTMTSWLRSEGLKSVELNLPTQKIYSASGGTARSSLRKRGSK
jgi:dinuclear metal center YbgI/SA1388 family protein